nr:alpha/beta hydrolase fold domain-containing protein [Microbacterium sp. MF43]
MPPVGLTPSTLRKRRHELARAFDGGPDVALVSDGRVDGVPVRRYSAEKVNSATTGYPLIYVHGGGWVAGDTSTHDGVCRDLCASLEVDVLSVDFRRPPEDPYPSAVEDVSAVIRSFTRRGLEVLIAGDGSGAHVAVQAAVRAPGCVAGALLIQPACDPSLVADQWDSLGSRGLLTKTAMRYFWSTYLAGARPLALWDEDLRRMPLTCVVTTSLDPSAAEAHRLVVEMRAAGVTTHHVHARGYPHGAFTLPRAFPSARPVLREAAAWLVSTALTDNER